MTRKTFGLIIILVIVTGFLLAIATNNPKPAPVTNAPVKKLPVVTPVEHSSLSLSPNPLSLSSPSATIDVNIDSGINDATAVQIELSYDPKMITITDIKPGSFFENPLVLLKNINPQQGKLTYAVGISPSGNPKKGIGEVAVISFITNMTPGQKTELKTLPKTMVTASGVAISVLKQATGATIIYGQNTTPAK